MLDKIISKTKKEIVINSRHYEKEKALSYLTRHKGHYFISEDERTLYIRFIENIKEEDNDDKQ